MVLTFNFNNQTPEDFGAYLYDIPVIKQANDTYTQTRIPGRRGALVTPDDSSANASIAVTLGVVNQRAVSHFRELRRWLRGSGLLTLSEDSTVFYRVLYVDRDNVSRELTRFGTFSATFYIEPYEYAYSGESLYMPQNGLLINDYDSCYPVYYLAGSGTVNLVVNGNTMTCDVVGNMTIDTRLQVAYNKAGTNLATSVSGNYEGLKLTPGKNAVAIAGQGVSLKIKPRWGYEL